MVGLTPWLRSFLSWRGFVPIARLSYAINMVHFRVLMELAYHHKARSDLAALVAGAASGGSYPAFLPGSLADFAAVGVLWVAGMAASMAGPHPSPHTCTSPQVTCLSALTGIEWGNSNGIRDGRQS